MKILLNNEKIDEYKNILDINYITSITNKNIINDLINDDDEIVVDPEIFENVNDDEFVDNIIILCIINYFKGIINDNDDIIELLDYYIYKKFVNINDVIIKDKILNYDEKRHYYYYHEFINNVMNYNFINFLWNLLNIHDIHIDYSYYYIENYDECYDINLKNVFLIDIYDIDDILKHDNNDNYVKNYNELIECIYYYDDDVIDDIDELFDISENIKNYVNYDDIIDDLIIDDYYIKFNNYYFHNCYF